MKAKNRFWRMLRIVARDSRRARTMPRQVALEQGDAGALHRDVGAGAHGDADVGRGERRRVVDAVAGHRDHPARALQRSTTALFWSGRTSASTSSMPSRRATALAVVRLSPVSITTRMPSALSAASASGVEALIGSAMARTPAARPSTPTKIAVAPSCAQRLRLRPRGTPDVDALLAQEGGVAEHDLSALDRAERALAGRRLEVRRPARWRCPRSSAAVDDRGGERVLARALEARGEAQHLVLAEALRPATMAVTAGLPSVSVPVLSTTSVSTFSMRSSASAFLISTPACAPRPTPTMIDIGVARPSAHGQAMISTATAATRP